MTFDQSLGVDGVCGRGSYQNNVWQLPKLHKTTIDAAGKSDIEAFDQAQWSTAMTPQMMSAFLITPEQLSIQQLRQYMMYLRENSQDTRPYQLAYWQKIDFTAVNCCDGGAGDSVCVRQSAIRQHGP